MNSVNENNPSQISLPAQTNPPQFWARLSEGPLRLCAENELKAPARPFAPPALATQAKEPKSSVARQLIILLALVALSVASYYLVSRFVVTAVVVQGRSMAPTLKDGERYFLNRWLYLFKPPQRGDLVVIHDPGHHDFAVKRIIAGPSDRLRFLDGAIYLNGKKLDEPYLADGTATALPNHTDKWVEIGTGQYFVMGDNRANSEDSRVYGQVKRGMIIGMICP